MKYLSTVQKSELSKRFDISVALIDTILDIESSGSGFDAKTGLIKIQFEPYWFQKFSGIRMANGVETQAKEYEAYQKAFAIDSLSAMKSTSWGLGQVMGFNHKLAGYISVSKMVDDFKESEQAQLNGMLNFIKSQPKMYKALKDHDWNTFASLYNGKNYKQFAYDTKLAKAYSRHSNLLA